MCLFSFGLYFWVLIPNLYLVQSKCCFSAFVCLRPIFLILIINLPWNFSLNFGVVNLFKSSVALVYLRPIFLYFFTNLNWNKCWFIPIFCHRCGKHLNVTIIVRRCCCGLYFEGTSSKILTSIFDLQSQMINSFGALPLSQSTEFSRKLLTGALLHTMFQRCFIQKYSQGVLHGI